ncbi:MAG: hypothetical protein ACOC3G_01460 [Phycisphaeraceae bacterium]
MGRENNAWEQHREPTSRFAALSGGVGLLGLPPSDPYWADPDAPWTAKRVWAGEHVALDHALHDGKPY